MELHDDNRTFNRGNERRLTILYATQTGNAQDLGESLARHAIRQHFTTKCLSLEDFTLADLGDETCAVFLISTTADGENPDSMKQFWKMLLNRNIPQDFLEELSFAIFGLGDSKFCFPAKKLQRRLLQLGAREILPRADADDQHPLSTDGIFLEWSTRFWKALDSLYPAPSTMVPIPDDTLLPPRYVVVLDKSGVNGCVKEVRPLGSFPCKVKQNKRMTASGHWQDVRHIILESHDQKMDYEPGDIAVIWPENPKEEVDVFLDTLRWTDIADAPLSIAEKLTSKGVITRFEPPTLRTLATSHLDICSVPRRSFFEMLKHFSSNQEHVDKFIEFCTPEGQEELWDYTTRPRRTIVEVLADFWSSLQIPIEYVLDIFPPMKPRRFSIASSLRTHPGEIHLCVAIVKYRTTLKRPRHGICTRWLAGLPECTEIPVGLVEGGMRIPKNHVPCIFVGPGTGIAPMRAMIEQRVYEGAKDNILVFGNRNREKDFLFENEWNKYRNSQHLSILLAFSRDGPIDEKKTYVQDVILRDAKQIYDALIHRGGCLFISGSSGKMPQGVKEAIIEIIHLDQEITKREAQQVQNALEKAGRWKQETW